MQLTACGEGASLQSPVITPTDAPLSPQWAFVVQFRAHPGENPSSSVGRVEHLVSGRTAQFQSLEELSAYLARELEK